MPKTIVRCSKAGCRADAESKIAAPWTGGRFSELKTFGYACQEHTRDVLADAERRPRPLSIAADETVGAIGVYDLAPQ